MILLKNRDRNPSFKKGEYVEINDAGNYPMELSVDGVCEQETTSGKNLIDVKNAPYNILSGVTIEEKSNNYLKVTTNNREWQGLYITTELEAGTYYYKHYTQLTDTTDTNGIETLRVNKNNNTGEEIYNQNIGINVVNQINSATFTITEAGTYAITYRCGNHIGKSRTILIKDIIISKTDVSYEPYTGGQPSPSPDYPQEIKTITGNLKLTSCGKNLFDNSTTNDRHYITEIGTIENGANDMYTDYIPITPNTNYYLSGRNNWNNYCLYDKDKMFLERITGNVNGVINITNSLCRYIVINATITSKNTMQLEKGSTATPYEPYQSSSLNIKIPENEFVGKINDTYKDTLNVVYKEDGHYHLILNKMIGKIVLNGSETFYINAYAQTLGYNIFVYKGLTNSLASGDNSCKSNYFIHYSWGQFDSKDAIYQNSNWIMFKCDSLNIGNDIDKFKEWLSTHNTEVYYALATPYEVDLGTVDTLLSYDKITNIFSDSDLYPVINAKYYKDFEFDKILRSGYNIDEQEYEIAKKQMANGKRKRILSSYVDCIIKINLGLLDNKTYQEYKEQLNDGEFHYWSYKYNQYKKANFILTKPSITTEYAYDDDIGINDMEITLEKSSDIE